MTKKEYMKPTLHVVETQQQSPILNVSIVKTNGLDSTTDLQYDDRGGDQGDAW